MPSDKLLGGEADGDAESSSSNSWSSSVVDGDLDLTPQAV